MKTMPPVQERRPPLRRSPVRGRSPAPPPRVPRAAPLPRLDLAGAVRRPAGRPRGRPQARGQVWPLPERCTGGFRPRVRLIVLLLLMVSSLLVVAGRLVWVQEDKLLRAVPLTLGLIENQYAEVVEGELKEGQVVVVGLETTAFGR